MPLCDFCWLRVMWWVSLVFWAIFRATFRRLYLHAIPGASRGRVHGTWDLAPGTRRTGFFWDFWGSSQNSPEFVTCENAAFFRPTHACTLNSLSPACGAESRLGDRCWSTGYPDEDINFAAGIRWRTSGFPCLWGYSPHMRQCVRLPRHPHSSSVNPHFTHTSLQPVTFAFRPGCAS